MQNLFQLGVRESKLPTPDSGYTSDGWVFERVAKGVSADHSSRAHDYKALLVRGRNIRYGRHLAARYHDRMRSSIQST
jgi:hypothetical protein